MKFRFFIMGLGVLFLCIFIFLSIFFKEEQTKDELMKKELSVARVEPEMPKEVLEPEIPKEILMHIAEKSFQEEIKLNYIKGELTEEKSQELEKDLEKIPFDKADFLDEIYKGILEKKINDYVNLR